MDFIFHQNRNEGQDYLSSHLSGICYSGSKSDRAYIAEWERGVPLFKQVLAKHKVPDREQKELLDIFNSTKADIVMAK